MVMAALGVEASVVRHLAFSLAASVVLLPVSISGLGARDANLVFILGLIGIGPQKALALSLLYFAIFGMALGLMGAVFWYRRPVAL